MATSSPTPAARPGGVAVLVKAMGLIDALADRGELTPAQLAEVLDEPRSTVYRLLATLQDLEFVEPGHRRGTYRLGLKLFALGSTVVERYDERAAAHPVMQRLHDETGETVFLCVRREHQAVCIERIDGLRVALLELRLGGCAAPPPRRRPARAARLRARGRLGVLPRRGQPAGAHRVEPAQPSAGHRRAAGDP